MRVAPEIQAWGEGPTLRESPYRVSCNFEALAKQTKKASAQGSLKFREVSNSFWEGPVERKPVWRKFVTYLLTYLLSQLVSQNREIMYFYMWLYCAFYKFLEVQIMHI